MGQFGAQGAGQVVLDIAHRHPTRIQRDDHVVEAAGATGTLGHQPRLEGPVAVARHRQRDVTDLAGQRLRARTVAGIRTAPPGRITLRIAQMAGQLGLQTPLQHRLHQLGQQPTLTGQRQPITIYFGHQVVQQPGIDHLVDRPPRRRNILSIISHSHLCTPSNSSLILCTDHLTPSTGSDIRSFVWTSFFRATKCDETDVVSAESGYLHTTPRSTPYVPTAQRTPISVGCSKNSTDHPVHSPETSCSSASKAAHCPQSAGHPSTSVGTMHRRRPRRPPRIPRPTAK